MKRNFSILTALVVTTVVMLAAAATVNAQPTYSVDMQSASVPGQNNSGDILTPQGTGVFPPPAVAIPANILGILPPPGRQVPELDALSYGTDPFLMNGVGIKHYYSFSVDEFAAGRPGVPGPSVTTEGSVGAQEAAGDIFASTQNPGPFLPYAGVNSGLYDGNGGFTPWAGPGLNLREPANPTVGQIDAGDNLDAWELDQAPPPPILGAVWFNPVYYSLDSQYSDPLEAPQPYNTGTAVANGFVSGDILVTTSPGGSPALFAPAFMLGLDKLGPDHDDVDALVLAENGDGAYTPPTSLYSWVGGATDMLLFSLRRGSAMIGQTDSLLGLPIEEGDILMPPINPGANPGIFVPAEALGLLTVRTNGTSALPFGFADDLDGLDVQQIVPEPATCVLMGLGLAATFARRRRLS